MGERHHEHPPMDDVALFGEHTFAKEVEYVIYMGTMGLYMGTLNLSSN